MINQLIKPIFFLTTITLPFWIVIRILINVLRKNRNEQISIRREILLTIFFIYIIFVAAITIMPLPMTSSINPDSVYTNFIPLLNSIQCFLPNQTGKPEMIKFCLENIVGNIILFVSLGFLLPLISDKFQLLKRVFIIAVSFSLSIEVIQFLSQYFGSFRTVDIDDIILNVLGACVGFYCFNFAGYVVSRNSESWQGF